MVDSGAQRKGGSVRLAYYQVAINAFILCLEKVLQNAFCNIFQSVLAIGRSNHLEVATVTKEESGSYRNYVR